MNELQQRLSDVLAEISRGGKWWGPKGQPISRFYFATSRKDAKAFLSFDDASTLWGAKLNVFIEDNGRCAAAWYKSQRAQLEDHYRPAFYAAMVIATQTEDAAKFQRDCPLDEEMVETLAEAGIAL